MTASIFILVGVIFAAAKQGNAFSVASSSPSSSLLQRVLQSSTSEWSVTDDWDNMSKEDPRNSALDSSAIFHQDLAWKAAFQMEQHQRHAERPAVSAEDRALQATITNILSNEEDEEGAVDTLNDHIDYFEEELGREISLLVRCNESPEEMLAREGRSMPSALSLKERNDPAQLVQWISDDRSDEEKTKGTPTVNWKMTPFFQNAVESMFQQYAREQVMDNTAVASWMRQSLKDEQLGPHDGRVRSTISLHGTYGKGCLTLENFCQLYLSAVVGTSTVTEAEKSNPFQALDRRQSSIQAVWRDIRNHGFLSPNEKEFQRRFLEFRKTLDIHVDHDSEMIMNECEITDEVIQVSTTTDKEGKSSYELVELTQDRKSPLYMNEGHFGKSHGYNGTIIRFHFCIRSPLFLVFIDEESCIGCTQVRVFLCRLLDFVLCFPVPTFSRCIVYPQCVSAAPASFRMVENGRARTYLQKASPDVSAAVATCPVDCMHFVSFDELKELETARDVGDGREDHRHFGHSPSKGYIGRTPLHVSRRGTDANHRSSWYQ